METVKQFDLPPEAYPRYRFTCQHVQRLNRKSHKLIKKCGISNDSPPEFGNVIVNVFCRKDENLLELQHIHFKELDKDKVIETHMSMKRFKKKVFTNMKEGFKTPIIFVASSNAYSKSREIPEFFGRLVILINDNPTSQKDYSKAGDAHIWVSTKESFAEDASDMLEMYVLGHVKERTELLYVMSNACNNRDYFNKLNKFNMSGAKTPVTPIKMTKTFYGEDAAMSSSFDRQVSMDVRGFLTVTPDEHLQLVDDLRQSILDLHGEILCMYARSNVHESEKPKSRNIGTKVDHCIADAIFNEVEEIKTMGNRFGTFVFFVENAERYDEEQKQQVIHRLNECLEKKTIHLGNYLVRFGTKEIRLSDNICRVGSKVVTAGSSFGTLGGFAEQFEGIVTSTCAITAKHVVENPDLKVFKIERANRKDTIVANILRPRQDLVQLYPVDICAARIMEKDMTVCRKKQRNADFEESESNVLTFEGQDRSELQGLPVHIWGATSNPGHGKITVANLYEKHQKYMVGIEDLETSSDSDEEGASAGASHTTGNLVFAKEGDSGAIVCADQFIRGKTAVNAISILTGEKTHDDERRVRAKSNSATQDEQNYTVTPNTPTTKGKKMYVSFQLEEGLRQLSQMHNCDFEFC
ncbi:uncharacterized protein LOC128206406 isoform X2 [Mya arenaria]|nr:uncharacterized protein LOC128206406 isoform X2 [Mya arenaria]